MTTEVELTNEQIHTLLKRRLDPEMCVCGFSRDKGSHFLPYQPTTSNGGSIHPFTPERPPDYLNDPGTLGEAERICKERSWGWMHLTTATGKVKTLLTWADKNVAATCDTLTAAWWTAIYRADEAERATR